MNRRALIVIVAAVVWPGAGLPQDRPGGRTPIEGLWSGAWGGGVRDGIGFQPVIAELLAEGDRVELRGFPGVGRLAGTVRLDPAARRLWITPAPGPDGRRAEAVEYAYEVKGDRLTLTDGGKIEVTLQRLPTVRSPQAGARVELVASAGIDDAGDLLVTRFAAVRAAGTGSVVYRPEPQRLSTKQATVLLVEDAGVKVVTVEAARRLVRDAPAVVVAYRDDERPPPARSGGLWDELGPPPPDAEAVRPTFARLLRPGTVVFVLSARENVPRP